MKTFDKKDVFTLVTAEESKAYIGKQGYFGDSFVELEEDIKKGCSGRLEEVCPDRYTSIVFRPYACETSYGLFLPTDKLKEVEEPKKWRAFKDYQEFTTWTKKSVGDVIYFRNQTNKEETYISVITSFNLLTNVITIGKHNFSLFQLFNNCEWLDDNNNWQPFGVLEE